MALELVNQIEYDLWDAVAPLMRPVVSEFSWVDAFEDMEYGGYPAIGVASLLNAANAPLPAEAVEIIERFIPRLQEFNRDASGVEAFLIKAKQRVGVSS
ncbi:hypothetical protein [Corynebacterium pseudodiphtheriticum]|uniref:hypothetical protein n=1 Tax=Corynebacterium pseudodiphtheriticum TaxID=37637 RepID=UPI00223C494C|nr:hypothetical protein [Corynebacterium pseudodiphtheriticum]MCT1634384.1 hypothetical protein [Corynebacterium pseudodiphtheriticum]MCT1665479.1 hypothetical protein [Corynebacterium pseudodiphtheriticum]MDK4272898.1 hypothetical protein [Corynebacterium pseudodiphtheriticum]MDK8545662.1 hypothetical protein [Corynebacterium pseudodiphtheriticum]